MEGVTDHNALNAAERQRLERIIRDATDEELGRALEHGGWTASVALAHIAFWDRFTAVRWAYALNSGTLLGLPPEAIDLLNEAALPLWSAVPSRTAAEAAVRAATEVDALIDGLPETALPLADGRPGMLDRSRHRRAHLDAIERAISR